MNPGRPRGGPDVGRDRNLPEVRWTEGTGPSQPRHHPPKVPGGRRSSPKSLTPDSDRHIYPTDLPSVNTRYYHRCRKPVISVPPPTTSVHLPDFHPHPSCQPRWNYHTDVRIRYIDTDLKYPSRPPHTHLYVSTTPNPSDPVLLHLSQGPRPLSYPGIEDGEERLRG